MESVESFLFSEPFLGSGQRALFGPTQYFTMEKEMATHSSILAWRIPGTGESQAAVCGVAQRQTRLKRLSSSSSSANKINNYSREGYKRGGEQKKKIQKNLQNKSKNKNIKYFS